MLFSSAAQVARRAELAFVFRLSVMNESASAGWPWLASDSASAHIEISCSGLLVYAVRYDACAPATSPSRSSTTPSEYGGAADFGSAVPASLNFAFAVARSPLIHACQPSW